MALTTKQHKIIRDLLEQIEIKTSDLDNDDKLELLEEFHDQVETVIDNLRNEIEDEDEDDEDDYEDSELEDEDEDEDEDE